MKIIDGEKVAIQTSKCGKRLKVQVIAGLFVETIEVLEKQNSVVKEAKEKCGDELFGALNHTLITFFALQLLAKTHNTKEFEEIFANCQVEEKQAQA